MSIFLTQYLFIAILCEVVNKSGQCFGLKKAFILTMFFIIFKTVLPFLYNLHSRASPTNVEWLWSVAWKTQSNPVGHFDIRWKLARLEKILPNFVLLFFRFPFQSDWCGMSKNTFISQMSNLTKKIGKSYVKRKNFVRIGSSTFLGLIG